jgi:GT2 family glycosyltransferase
MKDKVSIIIPVKEINNYIYEAIPYLLNQTYKDFEIIIFPDKKDVEITDKKVRIIETGEIGPAEKRDLSLKYAKGEILAFIDDDAYPEKDWIEKALKNFEDKSVGAVGGPNLTPERSNKFQKASGFALSTSLVSGSMNYRYKIGRKKEIDDFPSCNLFVRKNIFKKIGGFNSNYWPGEDTKLCLEIIKLNKKIIYDPKVIVYHNRRKNLNDYLKQIFSYSKHRGYFAKQFDKNSLKLAYFVPSLFLISLFIGPFLFFVSKTLFQSYALIILLYIILTLIISLYGKIKGINFFKLFYIIFLTHIIYGMGFIIGMFKNKIKEE